MRFKDSEKICMITGWKKRDSYWMSIGSPDIVPELRFRGYLETRKHGLSGLRGHKNGMRMLQHMASKLRKEDTIEGLNNKIRVIQRRAYGLRDEEYLRLKILTCMLKEI